MSQINARAVRGSSPGGRGEGNLSNRLALVKSTGEFKKQKQTTKDKACRMKKNGVKSVASLKIARKQKRKLNCRERAPKTG